LREDGMLLDDGVTVRLGENHFLMSASTGHIQEVYEHLTNLLQTKWKDLEVVVTDVTENWFTCALAGPKARDVLEGLVENIDVSKEALPFLGAASGRIAGMPARIFRISFSGELAYEINVPSNYG